MSLDDIDKIERCAHEVLERLEGATMEFGAAVEIRNSLNAIPTLVGYVKAERSESDTRLLDIIEGLLVNWPHTESVEYVTEMDSRRCVLTKAEALKRAAAALKNR